MNNEEISKNIIMIWVKSGIGILFLEDPKFYGLFHMIKE